MCCLPSPPALSTSPPLKTSGGGGTARHRRLVVVVIVVIAAVAEIERDLHGDFLSELGGLRVQIREVIISERKKKRGASPATKGDSRWTEKIYYIDAASRGIRTRPILVQTYPRNWRFKLNRAVNDRRNY